MKTSTVKSAVDLDINNDIDIGKLVPDSANPRGHDRKNLDAIKKSLLEFGQVEPLIVQAGTMMVVGGNGRLQAMRELGIETAWCHVIDMTDAAARRLSITLNRTGELAHWDMGELTKHIQALGDADIDLPGWDANDLLGFMSVAPENPEDVKPPTEHTQKGPTVSAPSRQVYVDVVLSMKPEDRAMVYQHLTNVKERQKLDSISEALVFVCRGAS